MRNPSKIAAFIAAPAALSLLLVSSAFAEDRPRDATWRDQNATQQHEGRRNQTRSDDRTRTNHEQNQTYNEQHGTNADRGEARGNDAYRGQNRGNDAYRGQNRGNDAYRGQNRGNDGYRSQNRGNDGYRGEARHDGHISTQGRIRSFSRERDGYRVYLDRGDYSYWVPASALGRHRLSVGLDIRLGGIFRGGYVNVDALGYPGDPYYNDPYAYDGYGYGDYGNEYITGRVERVDYRDGRLLLRDDRSGRVIDVDMRAVDQRYQRLDLGDVRRGDRLTLTGVWSGGAFRADRIDALAAR